MAELEGFDDDQTFKISSHGANWLMSNFHWEQNERAILVPNQDTWVMTPPEMTQLPLETKDN